VPILVVPKIIDTNFLTQICANLILKNIFGTKISDGKIILDLKTRGKILQKGFLELKFE
jgi:hypothetical protein